MKRTLLSPLLLAIVLLFGAGIFVTQFSLAEEPEDQVVLLQDQMQQLIQAQLELTQALKGEAPADQGQNDFLPEPQQAGGDGTNLPPAFNCTSDYLEWPSSDTYKESDWAMEDILAQSSSTRGNFMDLNGDGLLDYFYIFNNSNIRNTCVQFNTGRGWELVYKCNAKSVFENNVNTWTFYGDCAQTE